MQRERKEWLWSLVLIPAGLLLVVCGSDRDNPDVYSPPPAPTPTVVPAALRADGAPMTTIPTLDFTIPPSVGAASGAEGATGTTAPRNDLRTWIVSIDELTSILRQAGWPDHLIPEALRVVQGESGRSPGAIGDGGRSLGLFQLNAATWAPYCGVTPDHLLDPLWNAWCAYKVYLYDLGRGNPPWRQWSVKP